MTGPTTTPGSGAAFAAPAFRTGFTAFFAIFAVFFRFGTPAFVLFGFVAVFTRMGAGAGREERLRETGFFRPETRRLRGFLPRGVRFLRRRRFFFPDKRDKPDRKRFNFLKRPTLFHSQNKLLMFGSDRNDHKPSVP